MKLRDDLPIQINLGLDVFKKFIEKHLKRNPNLLSESFWTIRDDTRTDDLQTILSYLIHKHTDQVNLSAYIQFILSLRKDLNLEQPLHLAYELGKFSLAELIFETAAKLEAEDQDLRLILNQPNTDGLSLLHLVIDKKNLKHLNLLLQLKPSNVNQLSQANMDGKKLVLQPLHQAVIRNFPEAIKPLINAGAQLLNPCGSLKETPLLLAARLKHIAVIKAFLETQNSLNSSANGKDNSEKLMRLLHEENRNEQRPIEVICGHLKEKKDKQGVLTGIAVLLCHGSDVPRDSDSRNLLKKYRKELLLGIEIYLKQFPHLASNLLKKCHDKNQVLHDIIYTNHSRWTGVRYFFKKTNDAVFNLESLVGETENTFTKKEILFSQFVKNYRGALQTRGCFFNPFSPMLCLVLEGKITDWEGVLKYVEDNPNSRSKKIVDEMRMSLAQSGFPKEDINEEMPSQCSL